MDDTRTVRFARRFWLVVGGLTVAVAGGAVGFGAVQAQGDPPVARVLVSIRSTAVPVHGPG